MISVIDNYLEKPDFETLEIAFTSNNIAWYYNTYVANKNEKKFKKEYPKSKNKEVSQSA